jgi:hypothetical protein
MSAQGVGALGPTALRGRVSFRPFLGAHETVLMLYEVSTAVAAG